MYTKILLEVEDAERVTRSDCHRQVGPQKGASTSQLIISVLDRFISILDRSIAIWDQFILILDRFIKGASNFNPG